VLDWHFKHYPLLRAQDVYKLVHQGVFGPGHIIRGEDQCRKSLEQEFTRLSSQTGDPESLNPQPTEPLDPEGKLVRVNLEPFRSDKGAVTRLVRALIETARTIPADSAVMQQRLSEAIACCREKLPDRAVWLQEMADAAPKEGFPPIHHSRAYEIAYRPAYRVVRLDLFQLPSGSTSV
jgi:hypothetical protein